MARFDETVNINPNIGSLGASSGDRVSAALSDFARSRRAAREQRMVQHQQREGSKAFEAGKDPEFKKEGGIESFLIPSIGKSRAAYNSGLRDRYVADVQNDLIENVSALAETHKKDLIGFNDSIESYKKTLSESIDPSAKELIGVRLDGLTSSARTKIQAREIQQNDRDNKESILSSIQNNAEEAARFSREGDAEQSEESLAFTALALQSAVNSGQMSDAEASERMKGYSREVKEQSFRRQVKDMDFEDAVDFVGKMDKSIPKEFTADEITALQSSLLVEVNRKRSVAEFERKQLQKAASERMSQYSSAVSLGIEVPLEEKVQMSNLAKQAGMSEQLNEVNQLASFSLASAQDRSDLIQSARSKGLDGVDMVIKLEKQNTAIDAALDKDAMGFAAQQGQVELEPLGDEDSFQTRAQEAERLTEYYQRPISPFTSAELDGMMGVIEDGTSNDQVGLIASINAMPINARSAAYEAIAGKQALTFAQAGAIASKDPQLSQEILLGQEAIKLKTAKALTLDQTLISAFDDIVQGVYAGEDRASVLRSAISLYASRDSEGVFNSSEFKQAVRDVTGGIGRIQGSYVQLPRGISENDLEEYFGGFTEETIADLGGVMNLTNNEAAMMIRGGIPLSIGDDRYTFLSREGTTLYGSNGKPLVVPYDPLLDINKQQGAVQSMVKRVGESSAVR